MMILNPTTAAAVVLHASDGVWIMFLQSTAPCDPYGPIMIESTMRERLAARLTDLNEDNAYGLRLIGLMPVNDPKNVDTVLEAFDAYRLHDAWFAPNAELLAFIAENAQDAISLLLAQTRPGALPDAPIMINEMADILGVSVPTVRRMIKLEEIPFLKFGRVYRFIAADVLASLERRQR
jgi:excisionase family DNA binding protein